MPDQLGREGIAKMDSTMSAYLRTLAAEMDRHNRRGSDELMISPAEVQLAIDLDREGVTGWKQQVPIGPYAADFCWPDEQIVVEVDGSQHRDTREYDARRDAYMRDEHGMRVLRVRAIDVFREGMTVVKAIQYLLVEAREETPA